MSNINNAQMRKAKKIQIAILELQKEFCPQCERTQKGDINHVLMRKAKKNPYSHFGTSK